MYQLLTYLHPLPFPFFQEDKQLPMKASIGTASKLTSIHESRFHLKQTHPDISEERPIYCYMIPNRILNLLKNEGIKKTLRRSIEFPLIAGNWLTGSQTYGGCPTLRPGRHATDTNSTTLRAGYPNEGRYKRRNISDSVPVERMPDS